MNKNSDKNEDYKQFFPDEKLDKNRIFVEVPAEQKGLSSEVRWQNFLVRNVDGGNLMSIAD